MHFAEPWHDANSTLKSFTQNYADLWLDAMLVYERQTEGQRQYLLNCADARQTGLRGMFPFLYLPRNCGCMLACSTRLHYLPYLATTETGMHSLMNQGIPIELVTEFISSASIRIDWGEAGEGMVTDHRRAASIITRVTAAATGTEGMIQMQRWSNAPFAPAVSLTSAPVILYQPPLTERDDNDDATVHDMTVLSGCAFILDSENAAWAVQIEQVKEAHRYGAVCAIFVNDHLADNAALLTPPMELAAAASEISIPVLYVHTDGGRALLRPGSTITLNATAFSREKFPLEGEETTDDPQPVWKYGCLEWGVDPLDQTRRVVTDLTFSTLDVVGWMFDECEKDSNFAQLVDSQFQWDIFQGKHDAGPQHDLEYGDGSRPIRRCVMRDRIELYMTINIINEEPSSLPAHYKI